MLPTAAADLIKQKREHWLEQLPITPSEMTESLKSRIAHLTIHHRQIHAKQ